MDPDTSADADAALLSEALGLPASGFVAFSREPLGEGSVTGFEVRGAPAADAGDESERAAETLPEGTVAYVDTSRLTVPRETGLVSDDRTRVWIHPADPHLPALAPAAYGDAAAVLLSRLGATDAGAPQIVGYRPGRRAVLRVATSDGDMWVKVVRPRRIERVVAAHTRLHEHGLPVPAVRGWSPEGLLVLESARGVPATHAAWEPEVLLDAVDDLRARLAAVRLDWPARTSLVTRLPWYTDRLMTAMPEHRESIARITSAAHEALHVPTGGRESEVTVHGDLHLGQLFLDDDGTVTGLIDVDTAGAGRSEEDAAAFLGHAVASALLTDQRNAVSEPGGAAGRVWRLATRARARWGADPRIAGLTAVHLLGHALGAASGGDTARATALLQEAESAVHAQPHGVDRGTDGASAVGTDAGEPKRRLMETFDDA